MRGRYDISRVGILIFTLHSQPFMNNHFRLLIIVKSETSRGFVQQANI